MEINKPEEKEHLAILGQFSRDLFRTAQCTPESSHLLTPSPTAWKPETNNPKTKFDHPSFKMGFKWKLDFTVGKKVKRECETNQSRTVLEQVANALVLWDRTIDRVFVLKFVAVDNLSNVRSDTLHDPVYQIFKIYT